MTYHRIYADQQGNLHAGDAAVFGSHGETMSYNQFGELVDDFGEMDYPSLGDDYDDFGDMDYPSLGNNQGDWGTVPEAFGQAPRRQYKPRGPRHRRRPAIAKKPQVVQKTILTGTSGLNPGAGANTVTIRPQFDFVASDITFNGSVGAWTITSITFGDRIVFSNATGVPIGVFGIGSFLRGLVRGAAIAAGLDIAVAANLTASTTTSELPVTMVGLKRGTTGCGPGAV